MVDPDLEQVSFMSVTEAQVGRWLAGRRDNLDLSQADNHTLWQAGGIFLENVKKEVLYQSSVFVIEVFYYFFYINIYV